LGFGKYSLFYQRPRYYPGNRRKEEKACHNTLSVRDANLISDIVQEKLKQGTLQESEEGEIPGVAYRVGLISENLVKIFVIRAKDEERED
jgi:hypothetical protein